MAYFKVLDVFAKVRLQVYVVKMGEEQCKQPNHQQQILKAMVNDFFSHDHAWAENHSIFCVDFGEIESTPIHTVRCLDNQEKLFAIEMFRMGINFFRCITQKNLHNFAFVVRGSCKKCKKCARRMRKTKRGGFA